MLCRGSPTRGACPPKTCWTWHRAPAAPAGENVRLSRPLVTHSGEVHVLTIREPVAGDYVAVGKVPFRVVGLDAENRRVEVDFQLAIKWLARLTGHDELVLEQLRRKDWLEAVSTMNNMLMDFDDSDVGN